MPSAEIVAIGTELLLGEILDTNTHYLARYLRNLGIDLYRATIVGDNTNRIAQVIKEAITRSDIVITTGGLGPTVDDPTRHAVARALSVDVEFLPELWDQIQERFRKYGRKATENNRQQALVPHGAIPISNPVGTAPAFIMDVEKTVIISVPGVPREMEYLMEHEIISYLQKRFDLQSVIKARVIHTAGVGESQIDEWVGDLEQWTNPTVGLLAHPGQTDIRVTVKAASNEEADILIKKVVEDIQGRIGEHIYGFDAETLEEVVNQKLQKQQLKLAILECNSNEVLSNRLKSISPPHLTVTESTSTPLKEFDLINNLQIMMEQNKADIGLGISIESLQDSSIMIITLLKENHPLTIFRNYGGPPALVNLWGTNTALDFLRRNL